MATCTADDGRRSSPCRHRDGHPDANTSPDVRAPFAATSVAACPGSHRSPARSTYLALHMTRSCGPMVGESCRLGPEALLNGPAPRRAVQAEWPGDPSRHSDLIEADDLAAFAASPARCSSGAARRSVAAHPTKHLVATRPSSLPWPPQGDGPQVSTQTGCSCRTTPPTTRREVPANDALDRRDEPQGSSGCRRHRRGDHGVRRLDPAPGGDRRVAGVRPGHRRRPDRGAGPVRRGGGAAHHRAPRAGPARRGGVAGPHRVQVGTWSLVGAHDLREGHGPLPRPPGRPGAHQPGRRPAAGLPAAANVATAIIDGTDVDHLPVVEEADAAADRRARPLDDPAPPPGRAGRVERRHLGSAGAPAAGPGRSGQAAGQERHAGAGHRLHGQRPVGVAADLPRGVDARGPAASSTRRRSASASSTTCPSSSRTDLAQITIDDSNGPDARRRRHRGRGPPAAHR